ncbi:MAG: glutathione S-transferase family protein [Proteobacteria bacterium]|nr:glutathione S-transferase family protein [Pseudomonadota bacterium]
MKATTGAVDRVRLVSFALCPYAQRSAIVLEEKRAPYQLVLIDLSDKPDWFLKVSPFGRVPLLLVDGHVLFESAAIAEYIDETTTEPHLHPPDPLRRAQNRAWIETASAINAALHRLMVAATVELGAPALATVRELLARFADQLEAGPYFNGAAFSLVDAAIAPALQRLGLFERIIPAFDGFGAVPRIARWHEALLARPSVQRSTPSELEQRLRRYLQGDHGSKRATEAPCWLLSK